MVKNATAAMIKFVKEDESKERTRILGEIGQRRDACSPLIADLLLDAATSTSEKSCFLCFLVKQIWDNKQVHVLQ
jgi:hypothetical protein